MKQPSKKTTKSDSADKSQLELKELEKQKLEAELRQILAAAEREIAETQLLIKKWWEKPTWWGAIIPGAAAVATAVYAYVNLSGEVEKRRQETRENKLAADSRNAEADLKFQTFELQEKKRGLQVETQKVEQEKQRVDEQLKALDAEKSQREKEVADLKATVGKLKLERDSIPVKNVLDTILADEENHRLSFDQVYEIIVSSLKATGRDDIRLSVVQAAQRATSPSVKALLHRSAYWGTKNRADFKSFLAIATSTKEPNQFFWDIYGDSRSIRSWDAEDHIVMAHFLANELVIRFSRTSKRDDRILSALHSHLYGFDQAEFRNLTILKVLTIARNWIMQPSQSKEDFPLIQFIYQCNPYAGQLLLANLLADGDDNFRKEIESSLGYIFEPSADRGLSKLPSVGDQKSWDKWLVDHDKDLLIVLKKDAGDWPTD